MRKAGWIAVGAALVMGLGAAGCGDDDDDDEEEQTGVSFASEVHPILVESCGACHGTTATGGWAQADVAAAYTATMTQVNTTTPAQSPLLVNGNGGGDHPDALEAAEVTLIQTWIEEGAQNN